LICAAGGFHEALIPRQDDAAVEQQLTLNMTSHMRLIRWAIGPMMLQRFGRIVAVSSTAARFPAPGQSVYAAAKAGLEAFLKGCAMEFARKGITCNCVVPGYILTDFSKDYLMANGLRKVVPMERAGEVEEAAEAVLIFLGQHSDYLTGSQIVVDGGLSLAVKRSQ
jgi:NAD(P)-dependent dehydrogenase (short-subunit alcohol dehydrogenase family)